MDLGLPLPGRYSETKRWTATFHVPRLGRLEGCPLGGDLIELQQEHLRLLPGDKGGGVPHMCPALPSISGWPVAALASSKAADGVVPDPA